MTNDPIDVIEAILDQHPAKRGDWTSADVRANAHALEMFLTEWDAVEPRDTVRFERLERLHERFNAQRVRG